jgi:hypothetical protein
MIFWIRISRSSGDPADFEKYRISCLVVHYCKQRHSLLNICAAEPHEPHLIDATRELKPFICRHFATRRECGLEAHSWTAPSAPQTFAAFSPLRVFSETDKFQACMVNQHYDVVQGRENHRADAIVYKDSDPWHPWFIDFVQAQIDDPDPDATLRHLSRAHTEKINELVRSHINISRSSIIPFAFSSDRVIHPAALAFIVLFLCKAARTPINVPPSVEKMKVLHAISKAIVDQTATLITGHFSKFIYSLYNRSFTTAAAISSISAPRRGHHPSFPSTER